MVINNIPTNNFFISVDRKIQTRPGIGSVEIMRFDQLNRCYKFFCKYTILLNVIAIQTETFAKLNTVPD